MLRFLFRSGGNEEKEKESNKPQKAADQTDVEGVSSSGSSPIAPASSSLGSGPMARTAAAALGGGAVKGTEKPPTAALEQPMIPKEAGRVGEEGKTGVASSDRQGEVSLFKNLLGGLYDAILIFDSKGFLVAHNPRAEQYFGYSGQEMWGMRCADLVVGMDERMLFKIRGATASGKYTVITGKGRRRDGTTFPAEIAIGQTRILNEGDMIFSVHSLERQEKVREKQERMEAALCGTLVAHAVCDSEGKIQYVNPAFLRMVHLEDTPEQVHRPIREFVIKEDMADAMVNPPPPPGAWIGQIQIKGTGERGVPVLASSVRFQDEKGSHWIVVSLFPLPLSAEGI